VIKSKDIKKLGQLLGKDFSLKNNLTPVNLAKYSITMDNDYLSPHGYITKQQHLEADFTRELEKPVSKSAACFTYTWQEVSFSYQDKKNNQDLMPWTFARGLAFNYHKAFFKNCFPAKAIDAEWRQKYDLGTWYDNLVNVPAVNLLYMLTWDVIFFEEFSSTLISENINKIGEISLVSSLSDSYVHLSLKGCAPEHSFFKNGKFYAALVGISSLNKKPTCVYDFRSVGRLNVEKLKGDVKQDGESFFMGKIYLDLLEGDLIGSDMTELLTVSITNSQGKIVPMQKRRLVQLQKKG